MKTRDQFNPASIAPEYPVSGDCEEDTCPNRTIRKSVRKSVYLAYEQNASQTRKFEPPRSLHDDMDDRMMYQNDSNRDQASHGSASYTVLPSECSRLLDTLGKPSSRTILRETADTARTVDELLKVCDVSQTTIYRQVNELIDLGLLEESIRLKEGNQRQRQFRATSDKITFRIGPEGFEARVGSIGSGSAVEELLLDSSPQQELHIALSGKDLHYRIEAEDEHNTAENELAE